MFLLRLADGALKNRQITPAKTADGGLGTNILGAEWALLEHTGGDLLRDQRGINLLDRLAEP
jgi:hypothetical protein